MTGIEEMIASKRSAIRKDLDFDIAKEVMNTIPNLTQQIRALGIAGLSQIAEKLSRAQDLIDEANDEFMEEFDKRLDF